MLGARTRNPWNSCVRSLASISGAAVAEFSEKTPEGGDKQAGGRKFVSELDSYALVEFVNGGETGDKDIHWEMR